MNGFCNNDVTILFQCSWPVTTFANDSPFSEGNFLIFSWITGELMTAGSPSSAILLCITPAMASVAPHATARDSFCKNLDAQLNREDRGPYAGSNNSLPIACDTIQHIG